MRILDTDVCIGILRGNDEVIQRRQQTLDLVGTTWISAAELNYGAEKSAAVDENRQAVRDFLSTLPVFGLDAASAQLFGATSSSWLAPSPTSRTVCSTLTQRASCTATSSRRT